MRQLFARLAFCATPSLRKTSCFSVYQGIKASTSNGPSLQRRENYKDGHKDSKLSHHHSFAQRVIEPRDRSCQGKLGCIRAQEQATTVFAPPTKTSQISPDVSLEWTGARWVILPSCILPQTLALKMIRAQSRFYTGTGGSWGGAAAAPPQIYASFPPNFFPAPPIKNRIYLCLLKIFIVLARI